MGEAYPLPSVDTAAGEATRPAAEFDAAYFLETYGLTEEEALQPVEAGQYKGTLGQMLADERCPVGPMAAEAFQTGGKEALQQKLESFKAVFPTFEVKLVPAEPPAAKKK